ncbi:hypothetical protein KBB96_19485 [Luteolibacter ambystomatis]|uniref:Uncharacterized protein n=1 Tax=Luteolibacter ambystomatis TaxID=2824561 RepID=A0A975G9U5_9BACT|nr:hypothetical protein [Luteolibacter ambystomatis]QUE51025.1 hypothetical protein KBB96_19485 [Luteolibacter ambystomatis]
MTAFLEFLVQGTLMIDMAGVLGLAMLAMAAIRLARREHSWGGNMMAYGAVAILLGRVILVATPYVLPPMTLASLGPVAVSAHIAIPSILLSFGLAGVVWGLWGHARWLQDER